MRHKAGVGNEPVGFSKFATSQLEERVPCEHEWVRFDIHINLRRDAFGVASAGIVRFHSEYLCYCLSCPHSVAFNLFGTIFFCCIFGTGRRLTDSDTSTGRAGTTGRKTRDKGRKVQGAGQTPQSQSYHIIYTASLSHSMARNPRGRDETPRTNTHIHARTHTDSIVFLAGRCRTDSSQCTMRRRSLPQLPIVVHRMEHNCTFSLTSSVSKPSFNSPYPVGTHRGQEQHQVRVTLNRISVSCSRSNNVYAIHDYPASKHPVFIQVVKNPS